MSDEGDVKENTKDKSESEALVAGVWWARSENSSRLIVGDDSGAASSWLWGKVRFRVRSLLDREVEGGSGLWRRLERRRWVRACMQENAAAGEREKPSGESQPISRNEEEICTICINGVPRSVTGCCGCYSGSLLRLVSLNEALK